jgi:hypothetical protein
VSLAQRMILNVAKNLFIAAPKRAVVILAQLVFVLILPVNVRLMLVVFLRWWELVKRIVVIF